MSQKEVTGKGHFGYGDQKKPYAEKMKKCECVVYMCVVCVFSIPGIQNVLGERAKWKSSSEEEGRRIVDLAYNI